MRIREPRVEAIVRYGAGPFDVVKAIRLSDCQSDQRFGSVRSDRDNCSTGYMCECAHCKDDA
jgi:hypothetical protein